MSTTASVAGARPMQAMESRLKQRLERLIGRLDLLSQETADMEESLSSFLIEYHARVGLYLEQLYRLHHGEHATPSRALQVIEIPESTRIIERELRRIYHILAKRWHPDLRSGHRPSDVTMHHINQAYERRHLGALWKLYFEQEWWTIQMQPSPERLARLAEFCSAAEAAEVALSERFRAVEQSPSYRFMQKIHAGRLKGRDLIEEMRARLAGEVERKQKLAVS